GSVNESDYWPSRHASTDVPALLIWGEDDQTFVPEFIDNLGRYATNLTIKRLPNVGHTPMLEDPEQTNLILSDFLDV
ncbi:alpha/beta hydrolase, partial [Luminiphilus sp.]|nr:alpha/beta hydrolase [Luminiphilus sp.]